MKIKAKFNLFGLSSSEDPQAQEQQRLLDSIYRPHKMKDKIALRKSVDPVFRLQHPDDSDNPEAKQPRATSEDGLKLTTR